MSDAEEKEEKRPSDEAGSETETKRKERPPDDVDTATVKRAVRQIEQRHMSKAARTLMQNGVLDPANPIVQRKMEALHPQNADPMPSLPEDSKEAKIDHEDEVRHIITEMAGEGTSGGLSGMTATHLKPLVGDKKCLQGLMATCRGIVNGEYGDAMREVLVTSKGLAIPKQAGAEEPRPIGIPETLTRVAETLMCRRERKPLRDAMGEQQLGYGVSAGPESIPHLVQAALLHSAERKEPEDEAIAVMHLDIKNAFNTEDRAFILRRLYANPELRSLWRLANFIYGKPSRIVLRSRKKVEAVLISSQGTKQGCPLGMALFDLSMADDLQMAATIDPQVQVAALHDDIYLIGPVSKLRRVYEEIARMRAEKGSIIQARKTELACFKPLSELPEAVQRWVHEEKFKYTSEATRVAGGFVASTPIAADDLLEAETQDHNKFFNRVRHGAMPALHGMQILQKSGQPRFSFTTRATMPSVIKRAAAKFDAALIEAFSDKVDVPVEPGSRQHAQASLPGRLGGFGYRQHSDTAPLAWWSSQAACAARLKKFPYAKSAALEAERRAVFQLIHAEASSALSEKKLQRIQEVMPPSPEAFVDFYAANPSAASRLQKKLSEIVIAKRAQEAAGPTAADAARMKSLAAENSANRWALAAALKMSNAEVSDAVKRALGLPPAPAAAMPSTCGQCKTLIGPHDPWHPLTCVSNSATGKVGRHDGLVRDLKSAIEEAGGSAVQEPRGLDLKSNKKPDLDAMTDENLWIDAVVKHADAPSYLLRAGDCLEQAEKQKREKYAEMVADAEYKVKFVPFAVDTFGRLGKEAQALVDRISQFAQQNGVVSEANKFKSTLLQRLAITLQKHNSKITRRWLVDERWRAKKTRAMRELARAAARQPTQTE